MPKKLPWFRVYIDARNDSKLEALNDREFRIWFKLLCFAAEQDNRGSIDYLDPEFVAMELRLGSDELESAISRMVRLRLLVRSDQNVTFPRFAERQYDKPSDTPEATKARQHKRRSTRVSRDVTPLSRDVTRRTEQTRTETEGCGETRTMPTELLEVLKAELSKKSA